MAPVSPTDPTTPRLRLFVISILALATAGISFGLRNGVSTVLQQDYLARADALHAAAHLGSILGIAFLGFAFTIAIGSSLLDWLGMRVLLLLASLSFILGTLIVGGIDQLPSSWSAYSILWTGMLLTGIGWGLTECVINPLVASLYPTDKTAKLNILHAWWPLGIIVGSLISIGIATATPDHPSFWKLPYLSVLVPAIAFGVLVALTRFPVTERVASGVPTRVMFGQVARPMFLVWFLCMTLTAAIELAPGQWVNFALSDIVGMRGILLSAYVGLLMYVMRHFAGHPARRLSPVGLLWLSSLIAGVGLLVLSRAHTPGAALFAATCWGVGVCYLWPTMLASASERFPRGGALLMGLMGTAGTLSIAFFLPHMGSISDRAMAQLANGTRPAAPAVQMLTELRNAVLDVGYSLHLGHKPLDAGVSTAALTHLQQLADHNDPTAVAQYTAIKQEAHALSFEAMAVLPVALLVVFGVIWLTDLLRGGYRPTAIHEEHAADGQAA